MMLNIGKCDHILNGMLHDLNAKLHHSDHSICTTGHSTGKLCQYETSNESKQDPADRTSLTTYSLLDLAGS